MAIVVAHKLLPGMRLVRIADQIIDPPATIGDVTVTDTRVNIAEHGARGFSARPRQRVEIDDAQPEVSVQVFATIRRDHKGQLHLDLSDAVDSDFIIHDDDNDPIASDIKDRLRKEQLFQSVSVTLGDGYEVDMLYAPRMPS